MKNIISRWERLPVTLDLHTAALALGVTDSTVKRWLHNGTLQGAKIGRKWIFDRDYIRTLVQPVGSGRA